MINLHQTERVYRVGHLFCGIGAGARGFNEANPRAAGMSARFVCAGGVDNDAGAVRNFERLTGTRGTVLDLFSREQFTQFHGREPGPDWREASPQDIWEAHGSRPLDVMFLSAPCKGFSGLLSAKASGTEKYQALNQLTVRGMWLTLEAFKDDPISIILFENVPRIQTRGRALLDQIQQLLRAYGYVFAETTHDCGEIGGLAQSRKRMLMVARHPVKVPPFLYQPVKHKLRGVGEVIGLLPLPGDERAGEMHRVPRLQWKTWVRLAFVPAGKDWRALNELTVENGHLRDYGIMPGMDLRDNQLGVLGWDESTPTLTGQRSPLQGRFSVADPRIDGHEKSVQMGVRPWDVPAGVVTGNMAAGAGVNAVADPRLHGKPRFNNVFRIVPFDEPDPAIPGPGGTGLAVADPRAETEFLGAGKYKITGFEEPAGAVIGRSSTGQGAFAVADPRPVGLNGEAREGYSTQGHYGVVKWAEPVCAVPAYAHHDRGSWSVADPRDQDGEPAPALPQPNDRVVARIIARDNTWHRPFTTLELAALQSIFDPGEVFNLEGGSDQMKREWIGNAVPSAAARGMAETIGETLLLAASGETFMLSSREIWTRPLALALSVDPRQEVCGEVI